MKERQPEIIPRSEFHESMRGHFAGELHNAMVENPDIYVIAGDLGYAMFDSIREDFPERFINTGAAEQVAVGVACGLAEEGKTPFVYSITPFLLYRPFELLRNYLDHEQISVNLVGSGRDNDYRHDGFSHWAGDDKEFMQHFKNIQSVWPESKEDMEEVVKWCIENEGPKYVNLMR